MGVSVKEFYLNGRALTNLGSLLASTRTRFFEWPEGLRYANPCRLFVLKLNSNEKSQLSLIAKIFKDIKNGRN